MATEKKQNNFTESPDSSELSDGDVFAGKPSSEDRKADKSASRHQGELSGRDIFAGDEDFYRRMANAAKSKGGRSDGKRFSRVQKILIAGIVVISAVLLYGQIKSAWITYQISHLPTLTTTKADLSEGLVEKTEQSSTQKGEDLVAILPPTQPISLKVAQSFYLQEDYQKAFAVYQKLSQKLSQGNKERALNDFFHLQMGLCMEKSADIDKALSLFRSVLQSHSPVVRLVANYHCSLLEMQRKQYLKARMCAYRTLGLIKAVEFNQNWLASLKRDSYFLVAASMTKNVLELSDKDKNLPKDLWSINPQQHPFSNLSETQLRSILKSGLEHLQKATLGPQIQKLQQENGLRADLQSQNGNFTAPAQWSIICDGASIEELLSRFASNSNLDVSWHFNEKPTSTVPKPTWCQRPVTLYLPAVTSEQFVSIASGCAGLVGYIQQVPAKEQIKVSNPAQYPSLQKHISSFSNQAIPLWQSFLRTFYDDERLPNAHFALGLLHSLKNNAAGSIAEYKLVANRFTQSSLAPFALLRSSTIKSKMHDYTGARKDLKQLLEQYPESEIYVQAYLNLAEATMKSGLFNESAKLYQKVYHFGSSRDSQSASAFEAARCFYKLKDYNNTIKWLNRYISTAKDRTNRNFYFANYLLGKAQMALGNPEAAYNAFQNALGKQLSKEEYGETILALVEAKIQQEDLIEALNILENIHSWQVTQKDSIEMLMLKARILRSMGLADNAIAVTGDRAGYLSSPELKAKMSLELANCRLAQEEPQLAYDNLIETINVVEPGTVSNEISCKLAEVCLKLGKVSESINFCSQLLDSDPSPDIRKKALSILSTAYSRKKNYDRAALCLLGKWREAPFSAFAESKGANENISPDTTATANQSREKTQ